MLNSSSFRTSQVFSRKIPRGHIGGRLDETNLSGGLNTSQRGEVVIEDDMTF